MIWILTGQSQAQNKETIMKTTIVTAVLTFVMLFSLTSISSDTTFKVNIKRDGNDVVVLVDGEGVARAGGVYSQPKDNQEEILATIHNRVKYCSLQGAWAHNIAKDVAAGTADEKALLEEFDAQAEKRKMKITDIHAGNRIIRESFRYGKNDPVAFGRKKIRECLTS